MHISVVVVSRQTLLLEALQAAVVGTEFEIMSSPFKGRLALDEFAVTPPRCLILNGCCPKQSPLVMVDRVKRILPDTLILMYLRRSALLNVSHCSCLASLGSLIPVAQVKMLFWRYLKFNDKTFIWLQKLRKRLR
jgi:two-component system invasion response regulator UvrY